jgi:hypothetical protein
MTSVEKKEIYLKPQGKIHIGDLSIDGHIISKWTFKKSDVNVRAILN